MNSISPLDQIDVYITKAIEADDPDVVFNQIKDLEAKKELIEAAKSKFLFRLDEVWDQFSTTETLQSKAFDSLGYHTHTVERYIKLWKFQGELPESLQSRPVRELFPVTNMLAQGYEPDGDQWEELERANGKAEIDAVIRHIKGKEPRKGSLQIYVDPDGTVYAWMDDIREDIGYLNIRSKSSIIQKSVERIINTAGVIKV